MSAKSALPGFECFLRLLSHPFPSPIMQYDSEMDGSTDAKIISNTGMRILQTRTNLGFFDVQDAKGLNIIFQFIF